MTRIDLKGPDGHQKLPPTADETPESGWSFKRIVDALNEMFEDLYAAVAGVSAAAPNPLEDFTVATAPDPAENVRRLIYVSDGADGAPVVAFSDGAAWLRCDTKAEIAGAP